MNYLIELLARFLAFLFRPKTTPTTPQPAPAPKPPAPKPQPVPPVAKGQQTSDKGRAFIASYEGLFLQAYDDATDKVVGIGQTAHGTLTIGYGHTSVAGPPKVYVGQTITQDEANTILKSDLAAVEREVAEYIKVPLTQQQRDALVSFQFNTGWLAHPHCSLTTALNAGNYSLAASDFALYDRASGRVLSGLARRRKAEHDIFVSGNYVGNNGPIV